MSPRYKKIKPNEMPILLIMFEIVSHCPHEADFFWVSLWTNYKCSLLHFQWWTRTRPPPSPLFIPCRCEWGELEGGQTANRLSNSVLKRECDFHKSNMCTENGMDRLCLRIGRIQQDKRSETFPIRFLSFRWRNWSWRWFLSIVPSSPSLIFCLLPHLFLPLRNKI